MNPFRMLSRSLLGSVFVYSGVEVLRNPEPRAKAAAPIIDRLTETVPALPGDPVQVVQANAVLHVTAGSFLILGKMPRLAALALAGSLLPTTAGGHRFWEQDDPQQAAQQRIHFLKNAAILGGLLTAAMQPPAGSRRRRRRRGGGAARAARALGAIKSS
jgi:putative oxidoreductase